MTSPDFGSARHPRGRGFASDAPGDAPSPSWRPGPGPEGFDPDDLLAPLRAKVEKQMAGLTEKTPQQVALDNALGEESGHEANEKTGSGTGRAGRNRRGSGTGNGEGGVRTSRRAVRDS